MCAEQAILPIVDHRVLADFREIAAHQREMMIAVRLTDVAYAFERRFIADMAAQRIAGIRRVHDYSTAAQRFDRLAHVAALR